MSKPSRTEAPGIATLRAVSPSPSLIVLRNAELFDPEPRGRRDLLIAGERIAAISERGRGLAPLPASLPQLELELGGASLVPGLIDAHVHVSGGGGEAGFASRVPPLGSSELSRAGVTSVVGLLGTDGTTRTMRELLARTYALREEGLSAWCWTGNYELPVKTLTGSIRDDIVFVEPILGVGELAIADHRSSQPTARQLMQVAADVHVAGMIANKAGVLHLHMGDGAGGLDLIRAAIEHSPLPPAMFHPTHINRNGELFAEAQELVRSTGDRGACVDLTAFPADELGEGLSAAAAIAAWRSAGLPLERLTCSSDGGGCMPHFGPDGHIDHFGVGQSSTLLETIRAGIHEHGVPLAELLLPVTRNVARLLRLRGKGELTPGADADLLVLDEALEIRELFARGRRLIGGGELLVRGPFE